MSGDADLIIVGPRTRSRRDEVLELVSKRRSLKQIANELGISESTVNYHIRSLKELHGVYTLAQLADIQVLRQESIPEIDCRFSSSRESAVPIAAKFVEGAVPDDGEPLISFRDAMTYEFDAPWNAGGEPQVVPGVLEGANAGLYRAAVIVAIAVGLLALVLLGLGVAQGITAALSGVGAAPAHTK
jgi:biotin operon repressor